MICFNKHKLSGFSPGGVRTNRQRLHDSGGSKMQEYTEEISEQEIDTLDRAFLVFLLGIGTIMGMWFLSGLYYVILK